ncbi:hypothetical protein HN446_02450 [bacterium]|nr:hypothetical protein [bacterium]
MKKLLILFFLILISYRFLARGDCLNNSYKLTKSPDYKNYHPVKCDCPCYETIEDRNKCLRCKHYHKEVELTGRVDYEIIGDAKNIAEYFNSAQMVNWLLLN